ncbi:MAG: glycosyltransferase family 2 protein [Ignavibacteriales bacterium]|nr:glycosyltransferase family 2 protein [Ignavibacteriales bacterium]
MIRVYQDFEPQISVIMATFNRAKYFKRSINSLLAQNFIEWELLLVDDGSNDNTFQILNEYLNLNENIRYIKHKNRKLALSRNAGIQAAVGKYITFLDSDDEYSVDHLKIRFDYMEEHPLIDMIHGGVQVIGNPYVVDKYNPDKTIHLNQCTIGGTFFAKRKIFIELDGFKNITYSEDSDFLERAEKIFSINKVEFPTYIYHRDVLDSITNQQQKINGIKD